MIEEPPILTLRPNFPRPTADQIAAFQDVPTGFVCDAMGGQGALESRIQPIGGGRDIDCRAVGPALVADNGPQEILATMGALHILKPGDIVVSAVHGHRNCSAAGDQFCGMLKNKGAAGFVTDGEMRDYDGIVETGLPAWCTGLSPNSPYSNGPAKVGFGAVVGGVNIESGDLIVADRNGVVIVPFAEIDTVIARLRHVQKLEADLEEKVAAGFCQMPAIEEMIADGRAVVVE
ncbi:RraA family protein [Actibacterium pelagium]|uniref:Putative 4-hydroxy-4-methyl-2-oxoglutarate aldolase n=1 Tax=Actibacterium pelagium TaxID=2029103 RepID=A0A917ELD4_9RHOB|nr:RraA family protein [Actibacterium pelagium]GGE58297.1 diguanylate cyclase [Actibacterium pelagium]